MLAVKILMATLFFAIRSVIYVSGIRLRGSPKVLQISGGDVVLEVVSGEIAVNGWIDP